MARIAIDTVCTACASLPLTATISSALNQPISPKVPRRALFFFSLILIFSPLCRATQAVRIVRAARVLMTVLSPNLSPNTYNFSFRLWNVIIIKNSETDFCPRSRFNLICFIQNYSLRSRSLTHEGLRDLFCRSAVYAPSHDRHIDRLSDATHKLLTRFLTRSVATL